MKDEELEQRRRHLVVDATRSWPKNLTSQLLLQRLDELTKAVLAESERPSPIRPAIFDPEHYAEDKWTQLKAEIERLKAGKFTEAEIHAICHNLHGTVDAKAFADGCAAEQIKLYGCAPDRDALAVVYGGLEPSWARIRVDLYDCGPDVKSATRLFGEFAQCIVKLKTKNVAALDVFVVEVGCVADDIGRNSEDFANEIWGFQCYPTDDDGVRVLGAPEMFVAFEDIESIGVY